MSHLDHPGFWKARVLIVAALLCVLSAGLPAEKAGQVPQAGTIQLSPKDTYLKTDKKNYGTSTTLPVYTWPDNKAANAVLMTFDLSTIPAGAVVTGATLHLRLIANDAKPDTTYLVTAHKVLNRRSNVAKATGYTADGVAGWTANSCCGGAPMAQSDISLPYDSKPINKVKEFKAWTITTMVQEWLLNPASNFGVLLNPDLTRLRDRYRTFASMEYPNALMRPYLRVTYVAADVIPPTVAMTAPSAGNVSGIASVTASAADNAAVAAVQFRLNGAALGPEHTAPPYAVTWNTASHSDGPYVLTAVARDTSGNLATSPAVPVTVTNGMLALAPQDTSLNVNADNYSADTRLTTYTWPDYQPANAILMKFDLSQVPANAVVHEARLFLALTESDALAAPAYSVSASKVLNHNPVIALATGYSADGVTGWTPSSCCHDGVPLAQSDISAPYDTQEIDKVPGFKSWTLTTMLQEWLAEPSANFGLLLGSDASKARDHHRFFASMEHPDASLRPFLQVAYSVSDDATPPVVTGVAAAGMTPTAATISWTTDEAATSQVEYGTTPAYGSLTALDGALVTAHGATLNGLDDLPQSHYRVLSRDQAGNLSTAGPYTFTTLDGTAPAVSVTAPAAGATVSGTISVTANASDNAGVAGVQFRLDGANLGAEDTAAPYAASWSTSGVADGHHTLTAVARDAAGNLTNAAAIIVNVVNAPPPPPPGTGIAASYPGDAGIEGHPDVVFVERFDEATMPTLFGRWTDVLNGSLMSIGADAPAGSPVGKSLTIPWSAGNTGGHLYRQLTQGVSDTLYVRYYVKHPAVNNYQHSGIWMGGSNPPIGWPNPQAGTRPAGSDRFSAAAEQNGMNRFDHYNYWMGMRQSNDGMYWGNHLLNDPNVQASGGQWMCVEQMVKLNTPVTASNGEHAIWVNGVKVSHLGQGFPNGSWSGGIFTQHASGSPFEGFQWRNSSNLNLNWIWLQVYASSGSGSFKYAHVVAAKSYIGCLAGGAPQPAPPTVSMPAPANAATVSGAITVSATAADSAGVAGVQFRLDGAALGAEDTTPPYSVSWNTANTSNGSHTLTAVARNTSGLTTTSSPVTVTVSNSAAVGWPNEPAGLTLVSDWAMDQALPTSGDVAITGSGGWKIVQNASPGSSRGWTERIVDATAPGSPSNVLNFVYPAGMVEGNAPSTIYYDGLSANEVYVGFWWKPSSPFDYGPNGNKVAFIFNGGGGAGGQQFMILLPDGRLHILPEYPGDYLWRTPNVNPTVVTLGQWHRVEWYTNRITGELKWWLDGVLQGSYTNVTNPVRFDMFPFSPTWGGNIGARKTQTDHYWFDHARLSKR